MRWSPRILGRLIDNFNTIETNLIRSCSVTVSRFQLTRNVVGGVQDEQTNTIIGTNRDKLIAIGNELEIHMILHQ